MSAESTDGHAAPQWFVPPGEGDMFAWVALGFLLAAIYGLVTLYAAFDRWAEHQSQTTPFAKTIPTLLAIALLYEIFPLDHFHMFLPLSALLVALAADWATYRRNHERGLHPWQAQNGIDTDTETSGLIGTDMPKGKTDV